MLNSKYGSLLTVLLVLVIIGIIGVLGYFGYQWLVVNNVENAAQDAASEFDAQHPTIAAADENTTIGNDIINGVNTVPDTSTKKVMLAGYEVIGTIRIPTINVKYPILDQVTKKSLETAVAMITTEKGLNNPGNSVILGHNYRNNQFFSKNDKLKIGDAVYIKDKSGMELKYKIIQTFTAKSTDASFYRSNDFSKTRVVLSTCTDDASETDERVIVIAEADNKEKNTQPASSDANQVNANSVTNSTVDNNSVQN